MFMDSIGLKFACSPKMSLATDEDYCRRRHSNSTKRMQHLLGMGFMSLAVFLNPTAPPETS